MRKSKATALLPFRKKPSDFTVWPLSGLTAAQQQHLVTEMSSLFTFVLELPSASSPNKPSVRFRTWMDCVSPSSAPDCDPLLPPYSAIAPTSSAALTPQHLAPSSHPAPPAAWGAVSTETLVIGTTGIPFWLLLYLHCSFLPSRSSCGQGNTWPRAKLRNASSSSLFRFQPSNALFFTNPKRTLCTTQPEGNDN